jgi:hypothetical protein
MRNFEFKIGNPAALQAVVPRLGSNVGRNAAIV